MVSNNHTPDGPRKEFLLRMYDQLFNEINTHILVVWQSIGVLVSTIAVYALVEKSILNIDIANSIIVLICGWLLAHVIDAGYWYNRNLAIISNIEKLFLTEGDLRDVHYYFGKHRPDNKMLTHLLIQMIFSNVILFFVIGIQIFNRLIPALQNKTFTSLMLLPLLLFIALCVILARENILNNEKYQEFLINSPGIPINTDGINYGKGHGFRKNH